MDYTDNINQVVILKDSDIAVNLSGLTTNGREILSNGVPSFDLLSTLYNSLSTYDNNLCAYLRDSIDVSCDNLSTALSKLSTDLSNDLAKLSDDLSSEIDALSSALSGDISKLSTDLSNDLAKLSDDLSSEIDALSSALSGDISKLSTDLSGEIDDLYAQTEKLSDDICLSVIGVSSVVDALSDGLSTSLSGLSGETIVLSNYLNAQLTALWNDVKGGVNYKGHLSSDRPNTTETYDLSTLFLHNKHFGYTESTLLNNGWLYCFTTDENSEKYKTKDGIELEHRDYIIVHDHSTPQLSAVAVSAIGPDTIDIIDAADNDYVRLDLLSQISTILSTDYQTQIDNIEGNLTGLTALSAHDQWLSGQISTNTENLDKLTTHVNSDFVHLSGDSNVGTLHLSGDLIVENDISGSSVTAGNERFSIKLDDKKLNVTSSDAAGTPTTYNFTYPAKSGIVALVSDVEKLSTDLSNDLKAVSDTVELSVENLVEQIEGNDDDIQKLEDDLSILTNEHYTTTLSGIDRISSTEIKSDNLILTDPRQGARRPHDRYFVTFKYGTMILSSIAE